MSTVLPPGEGQQVIQKPPGTPTETERKTAEIGGKEMYQENLYPGKLGEGVGEHDVSTNYSSKDESFWMVILNFFLAFFGKSQKQPSQLPLQTSSSQPQTQQPQQNQKQTNIISFDEITMTDYSNDLTSTTVEEVTKPESGGTTVNVEEFKQAIATLAENVNSTHEEWKKILLNLAQYTGQAEIEPLIKQVNDEAQKALEREENAYKQKPHPELNKLLGKLGLTVQDKLSNNLEQFTKYYEEKTKRLTLVKSSLEEVRKDILEAEKVNAALEIEKSKLPKLEKDVTAKPNKDEIEENALLDELKAANDTWETAKNNLNKVIDETTKMGYEKDVSEKGKFELLDRARNLLKAKDAELLAVEYDMSSIQESTQELSKVQVIETLRMSTIQKNAVNIREEIVKEMNALQEALITYLTATDVSERLTKKVEEVLKIQKQIVENNEKIEGLKAKIAKFEGILSQLKEKLEKDNNKFMEIEKSIISDARKAFVRKEMIDFHKNYDPKLSYDQNHSKFLERLKEGFLARQSEYIKDL